MIRALSLIFLGAASFAAVYVLVPEKEPATNAPAKSEPQSAPPEAVGALSPELSQDAPEDMVFELRPGADPIASGQHAGGTIRDVTPDTMTAGPRITGTLAQVSPAPSPAAARTERLFNPIVASAGTIKARDQEIHLGGIDAPEFEKMCGAGATAWPCGRIARAALRSFIHSRAIDCEIPDGADKIPDPAICLVGGENMSEWLVAQGWAKRSGDDFADEEKKARQAKLGVWSDRRPDPLTTVATGGD